MSRILLCVINYRNYEITEAFLKAVKDFDAVTYVLDNCSDTAKYNNLLKYQSEKINFLATERNLGYFGGFKFVLDHLGEKLKSFDFIIISNNDIEFNDVYFFEKLNNYHFENDTGCIAPSIIIKNQDIDQNPFFKNKLGEGYIKYNKFFLSNYYLAKLRHQLATLKKRIFDKAKRSQKEWEATEIFAPHGAFIILTKNFFNRGGFIDTNFFLYGEELSIAYQCLNLKLKIIKEPSLNVIHNEHQTTSANYSRFKHQYRREAFDYILQHYVNKTYIE
ncbi:MAG: hypothetical protein L0Y77_07090 [Chlorobi bacterium]|nr:hypothetical protein [Chlorobiota bacterium]